MKHKLLYLIVGMIILVICPILSFAETNIDSIGSREKQVKEAGTTNHQIQTPGDNIEWVKDATRKYSPVTWNLLMKYENMPAEIEGHKKGGWITTMKKPVDTFGQLKGVNDKNDKMELLDRMALNVRVIDLALQRQDVFVYTRENKLLMDWDNAEIFFHLPDAKSYYVSFPIKSLFPSANLTELIPEHRRTFFFDTYIKGGVITQRFGVIGLMEEFHGYYYSSKFYFDMLEAYKTIEGSDARGFFEWVRYSQSTLGAFYELDYFIREYLLYMKNHRAADYEALKSCRSFVEAYGAIRSSYEYLVNQYLTFIETEVKRMNETRQIKVGFENGLLWLRAVDGKTVTGTHVFPEREKLVTFMNGDRYLAMMKDFPKCEIRNTAGL